jgi:hypothetical protein
MRVFAAKSHWLATPQADPNSNRRSGANMKWIVIGVGFILAIGIAAFLRSAESPANRTLPQKLFTAHAGRLRDNYEGIVGGEFAVAPDRNVTVTHFGYYDANSDGLQLNHRVGLYEPLTEDSNKGRLLVEETVPYGAGALLEDGYRWVALKSPVVLKANQRYMLAAEVFHATNDPWPDMELAAASAEGKQPLTTAVPDWNQAFVGTQAKETRIPRHSRGKWPSELNQRQTKRKNSAYGAANLAFDAFAGH